MKRLGSWIAGIAVALFAPLAGCGRRQPTADPPSPPPEIRWEGVDSEYRNTTVDNPTKGSRQFDR